MAAFRCTYENVTVHIMVSSHTHTGTSTTPMQSRHTLVSACHIFSSPTVLNGSRLLLRDPENSTGDCEREGYNKNTDRLRLKRVGTLLACGMMATRDRSSSSGIVAMSTPSSRMEPLEAFTIRNRATPSEDLPPPVRPTMPTFSRLVVEKVTPLRAGGRSGLYRITTFSNCGHTNVANGENVRHARSTAYY